MVEVFKTNVKQVDEAERIVKHLKVNFPTYKANFDLSDCDNILRVEGDNILVKKLTKFLILSNLQVEILP
jgi:LPS O-antigen subunit length determinant protein (WzzB/FepE family)